MYRVDASPIIPQRAMSIEVDIAILRVAKSALMCAKVKTDVLLSKDRTSVPFSSVCRSSTPVKSSKLRLVVVELYAAIW